jgi:hypothetical protein
MINITASQISTEFWSRALEALHPNDKQLISCPQHDPRCVLDDVLKEAQAKRDAAIAKCCTQVEMEVTDRLFQQNHGG